MSDILKSLKGLDHHLHFTLSVDGIDHANIKRAIAEITLLRAQLTQARSDALEEAASRLEVSLPEGGSGHPQDRTDKLIDEVRRGDVKFIRSLKETTP